MKTSLQKADISWSPEGLPYSAAFGDLYFSREDGLAETRHTFLNGNGIEQRFAALEPGGQFSILETGFGTGLNFLATLDAWQTKAQPQAQLDFISIEAYPLDRHDLARALELWPQLQELAVRLLQGYPHLTPGFHLIQIMPNVRLILIFADVQEALSQLVGPAHPQLMECLPNRIDACYLDGFAPRVNPDMWQPQLFAGIASLCNSGATLATFTSAGAVRRGLLDSGFSVQRVAGFGHKREMITATLTETPLPKPNRHKPLQTWSLHKPVARPESVTILGAGIAGVTLANSLAQQGLRVSLIEASERPMQGASGNAQAALFTRLSAESGELEDFSLSCLEYASRYYRDIEDARVFHACGLIQLPRKPEEAKAMARLADRFSAADGLVQFLSAADLTKKAGITVASDGLWMPHSGWIDPPALAEKLLRNPAITTVFNTPVKRINYSKTGWQLLGDDAQLIHETDCLVVCAGNNARQISGLEWLPTRNIRGQVSLIQNPALSGLRTLLCAHGYLTPEHNGCHSIGATYDLDSDSEAVIEEDHQQNLDVLAKLTGLSGSSILEGRAGIRCATPDYLPMCGPAPDLQQTKTIFDGLAKDAKRHIASAGASLPGLYLNLGYGSRGFCYAPLCAELLASQIMGKPMPLPHYLTTALHPARFIIRDIIRKK